MKFFTLSAIVLFAFSMQVQAQSSGGSSGSDMRDLYQLNIKYTDTPITVDGILNEATWNETEPVGDFWQRRPQDGVKVPSARQTEVRAAYDDKNLYFSAICYDTSYYVVQSLKRDTRRLTGSMTIPKLSLSVKRGSLNQYSAQITYRQQPWGNFRVNYTQNDVDLPSEYGDESLKLINLRAEVNFSTSVFWTTFFQFNTQNDNFNINSRLQWRFKPMSDLFLVYTDNYTTSLPLENRNRETVLRLNYWLTL